MRLFKKLKLSHLTYFFKSSPNLAFPGREIAKLEVKDNQVSMTANFLGLQGAATPLPLHFTEIIVQDDPDDSPLNELLNFFNQRFYEALIRIDEKYHYVAQVQAKYEDTLTRNLQALCGLPEAFRQNRQELYYQLLPGLRYLMGGGLSKQGLCLFLQRLYQVPRVSIRERVKKEIFIPKKVQNALGVYSILAETLILGKRVYQGSTHFELHVYVERVDDFLPGSRNFVLLKEILNFVLKAPLWVTLVLHATEISLPILSQQAHLQLGFTSVLTSLKNYQYQVALNLL